MKQIKFILLGIAFGIILVKAEVISWFRIQEMFRFQSFHMFGIIGSAVLIGMISVQIIKKFKIKTIHGEKVNLEGKQLMPVANLVGGILFGLGWAFTGACPGPIYALIGQGAFVFVIVLLAAYLGALFYGAIRDKIPH